MKDKQKSKPEQQQQPEQNPNPAVHYYPELPKIHIEERKMTGEYMTRHIIVSVVGHDTADNFKKAKQMLKWKFQG